MEPGSPALQAESLLTEPTGKPSVSDNWVNKPNWKVVSRPLWLHNLDYVCVWEGMETVVQGSITDTSKQLKEETKGEEHFLVTFPSPGNEKG